jgi:hypothetical protein
MISDLTTQGDVAVAEVAELFFAVPKAEEQSFAGLPDKVRDNTLTVLGLLQRIHQAKSKSAEARQIAFERPNERGMSAESLLRKYYRYVDTRDWRAVLDRAQAGPAFWDSDDQNGLPPAFVDFWKGLCERNQRATAPARRALLEIWRTHRGICSVTGKPINYKAIPGYSEWPQADGVNDYPKGWSVANLNRCAPKKYELVVARQGREAAAKFRRKVFTTRAGLAVGQFYLFDDLVYDRLVNFPGQPKANRPLGLVALDLYSACAVGLGFKPTLTDEDGTKRKLKERDMLWLVVDVLCNKGFRADERGTSLVVENGTAAIRPDFAERIFKATGGKVTVDRAGLSSIHMPGLFEGASKGNPRFKAALESLFNLVHNEGAALPGNTGKDRQHAPAQLAGLERYNTNLLKLARLLPSHRRELLQFPVLNYYDFVGLTMDIYARINARTEHELEGWQKCRHFVQEYYVDLGTGEGHWLTHEQWLALSPVKRAALEAAKMVNAKSRNLSPQEVWNRDANQLQKLGECMLPTLLGPDFGEERSVRGGYITIENQEIDSEPIRFPAAALASHGDKFLVYHSPLNPDRLVLTDAKGAYVGTLERQIVPTRADTNAVIRQLGEARKEEAALLAPVVGRAAPVAAANRDMHRNNARVVNGQPVSNEEIESARELRAAIKSGGKEALDDLLEGAAESAGQKQISSPTAAQPESGEASSLIDDVL